MKKTYISFLLILFIVNNGLAQTQSKAIELAKLFNSEEIDRQLDIIKQRNDNKNSSIKTTNSDLLKKYSEVYKTIYTQEEITNMLTFYNSNLGKKILKNEDVVHEKTASIMANLHREQRNRLIKRRKLVIDSIQNQKAPKQDIKQEIAVLPKINTLEDLKELVKKDPGIIRDRRLLIELFGEEGFKKLLNQNHK